MKLKPRAFVENDEEERAYVHEALVLEVLAATTARMKEVGMTRSQLASVLGKSPTQISQIFNRPRSMTMRTLAQLWWALDRFPRLDPVPLTALDAGLEFGASRHGRKAPEPEDAVSAK